MNPDQRGFEPQPRSIYLYGPEYEGEPLPLDEVIDWMQYRGDFRTDEIGEYEYWTAEYIREFSKLLAKELGLETTEKKKVALELGARSGALSRFIRDALGSYVAAGKIEIIAVDSYTDANGNHHYGINRTSSSVVNMNEREALHQYKPDIVVMSWPGDAWVKPYVTTQASTPT